MFLSFRTKTKLFFEDVKQWGPLNSPPSPSWSKSDGL